MEIGCRSELVFSVLHNDKVRNEFKPLQDNILKPKNRQKDQVSIWRDA